MPSSAIPDHAPAPETRVSSAIQPPPDRDTATDRRAFLMAGGLGAVATAIAPVPAAAQAGGAAAAAPRYAAPTETRSLDLVNIPELEARVAAVLPKPQFGYIQSGAGDEWTLRESVRAFDDVTIVPRYLAGVREPDTSTTLLGSRVKTPIFVPPMAAHGLAHASAEAGTAKGAADAGALFTAQTLANVSLERIAQAGSGPKWFQLYYATDPGINRELIRRAKAAGATAIVFTVDLEWPGNREADKRNGFVFPSSLGFPNLPGAQGGGSLAQLFGMFKRDLGFADLEFIRRESGLPVVVKGILSPENAREAVRRGASAIQVSNHGGRQLDTTPAPITVLPGIVDAVGGAVPVYLDGGVRRGVHVFKALAQGASGVAVGRPTLYGLALGGAAGVTSVLDLLTTELRLAMKLAGTATIADISRQYLRG